MSQAYDTDYGIFNHVAELAKSDKDHPDRLSFRPLASVELHPVEDLSKERNGRYVMAKKFADMKMAEIFGLSFIDFLNLPVAQVEELFLVAQEYNQIKLAADADSLKHLDNLTAKNK